MKIRDKIAIFFTVTPLLCAQAVELDSVGVNAGCMNITAEKNDKVGSVTLTSKPDEAYLQAEIYALLRGVFKQETVLLSMNYLRAQNSDFSNNLLMVGIKKYFEYDSFDFYIGGYAGYGQLTGNYYLSNAAQEYSSESFVGAFEVGSEYKISQNFMMGLGARYYIQDYTVRIESSPSAITEVAHPNACSLSLGVRYRFGLNKRVDEEKRVAKQLVIHDAPREIVQENKPEEVKKVEEITKVTSENEEVIADEIVVMTDADHDGVVDFKDACLATPEGFSVDANGCEKSFVLHINFAQNSTKIPSEAEADLNKFVDFMKRNTNQKVNIIGHSSRTPTSGDAYNLRLSKKRADILKAEIVKKGIDSQRITTEGRGFHEPLQSNDTKEGRAQNRRLEIEFLKE